MLRNKRRMLTDTEGEADPMSGVANMADVMLVLAVGIMIALVAAWNVDLFNTTPTTEDVGETVELEEDYETLQRSDDAENSESLEDYGLSEYGTLYQDEDGNLWIVGE